MVNRLFLIVLATSAVLPAYRVQGYVLENIVWGIPNPTIYVNLTASQAQLGLNLASFPLYDGSGSYNQVFEGAVATWDYYLENLQIQTVDGNNPNGFDVNNDLNEAGFGSSIDGSILGSDTLAVTEIYYTPGNPNTFAPTDIVFSTAYAWNSYRGPLQNSPIDLRRVALHELGHFIGLDHPDQYGQNVNAIMNSVISNTDDLTSDDVAGGQYLYGARSQFSQGSTAVTQAYRSGDFDGDGKEDLLWQNGSTGQVGVWLMNGSTIRDTQVLGTVAANWRIAGIADLNRDGKADVIWRDINGGGLFAVWYMNGASVAATQEFYLPADGDVAFFADLDGDGNPDAVQWSSSTGQLNLARNDGRLNFTTAYSTQVTTDWVLVGLADVTGTGMPSLVWRNRNSSAVVLWTLQNLRPLQMISVSTPSLAWRLRGIVRLSGSPADSFVWHNASTGAVAFWSFMTYTSVQPTNLANAGYPWEIYGSMDFDGSGSANLVWRNAGSGSVGLWGTIGNVLARSGVISIAPGGTWRLQPDPGD
ncbi:MAG: VCBS repeat-containing protein [Verrucomicrobia bacterium]|nr:VCBS repeat-containing protein [Verrucomicrobiota bacterium]